MSIKPALVASLVVSFLTNIFGHNPSDTRLALREFHLKNNRHVHATFLMMRHDSVFLEKENGAVLGYPLSAFATADQAFLNEKKAAIEQLNQQKIAMPQPIPSVGQPGVPYTGNWLWLLALLLFMSLAAAGWFYKKSSWSLVTALAGMFLLAGFKIETIQKLLGTDPLFMDAAFQPFKPHVATHWDASWFYVESNGLPTTHSMMTGITSWQQQVPIPQCYIGTNAWQIPLNPVLAAQPVPVNDQHFLRGAVAIAANGIPIFNPHTNTGVDAFLDGQLDQWGGHSGRADDYHYHIAPLFLDTQTVEILPIAFALDGFSVYAGLEPDGTPMLPLDTNHGHFDPAGVYHYHGTPEAPYMIGAMVGKVTEDATLQIIPQAKAMPVRPSLTPLNGATITNFQPNGGANGYILTYTRNGQTFQVDYSWTPAGVYTYRFISPNGTTTETYNGHVPCQAPVSTDDFFEKTQSVMIFPNPTTGRIYLKLGADEVPDNVRVQIFDVNGKRVFETRLTKNDLEIGGLAKGIYLTKIIFEKGEVCRKIIVQ